MSSVAKDINELYPMTPWWTNLVAVVLTAVAAAIIVAMSGRRPSPGAPSTTARLVTDTALFLPHALILFGIFADMFAYRGAYATASSFGLLALPFNKILDTFWYAIGSLYEKGKAVVAAGGQKGGVVLNYPGCYIQGLETIEWLKPQYSSQTLVVTGTIMLYYIFDLLANKGLGAAFAPLVVAIVLFVLQATSMSSGGCFPGETLAVTLMGSVANSIIMAFIFYLLMESFSPGLLPSKVIPSYKAPSASSLTVDETTGKMVDKDGKAWTFAPDGSLIPDTCPAPGTGNPATEGSCAGAVTVN